MRYLIGLVSIIGLAAGLWMLQPADDTTNSAHQTRTPVVRITDIPLPSQSTPQARVPLSEHERKESNATRLKQQ